MPDDPNFLPSNIQADVRFDLNRYDPVDDYLNRMAQVLTHMDRAEINQVISVLFQAWKEHRQIFIIGNGGSAATASHMANDLCKLTAVAGKKRFKAFALTDNVPLLTAWGNDTCYEEVFAEQLINYLEPDDILIAISTSGESPNILRALEVAKECGARRIGFTGNDGGRLKGMVDYCIYIPDGHVGRQEDGHMVLDHVITNTLHWLIAGEVQ
jgi:D-sedoheptulose 7-phosphate isomerase